MAQVLTGFGTVAWLSTRPPPAPVKVAEAEAAPQAPKGIKKHILVAAQVIPAGSLVKPEHLVSRELLIEGTGEGLFVDSSDSRAQIVGSMLRRGLNVGEMVQSETLMKPGDHGFLAAVLGQGMRALTIGVDATTGSAGLISPGDRVDVILTQTLGDAGVPMGRRVAAETVLRNARVIAIDQQLIQGAQVPGGDSASRTVTLEVAADQAERLSVAVRLGRLSLSLRSASDRNETAESQSRPVWARDVSPALGGDAAPVAENVVRIFQGGTQAKEFKF